ncbi:MAG: cupin domain-containing protein [Betaproteobacteria bacterium]
MRDATHRVDFSITMPRTIGEPGQAGRAAPRVCPAGHLPRDAPLTRLLDVLRSRGWFFCVSDLTAQWALQLPGGRLAAIHAALQGECVLTVTGVPGDVYPHATFKNRSDPSRQLNRSTRPGKRPSPLAPAGYSGPQYLQHAPGPA